jgi:hypothetical protein
VYRCASSRFFGGPSLAMTTAIQGSTVPRNANSSISHTIW